MKRLFALIFLLAALLFGLLGWQGTAQRTHTPDNVADARADTGEQHTLLFVSSTACLAVGVLLLTGVRIGKPGPLMARSELKQENEAGTPRPGDVSSSNA